MIHTKLKNNTKIDVVLAEVSALKSAMIGWMGRDKEGDYNPKFVDDVLSADKDDELIEFTGKGSFLNALKK